MRGFAMTRNRQPHPERRPGMSLVVDPRTSAVHAESTPGSRLREYAVAELMRAARQLAQPGEQRHAGVHEARKSIRRARAVLALATATLGKPGRRLDRRLRDILRSLSDLRDAQALEEVLLHLGELGALPAGDVERLLLPVRARKRRALDAALTEDPGLSARRADLAEACAILLRCDWRELSPTDLKRAHDASVADVHAALDAALASPDPEAWHRFRRRLRRLRQQESALAECCPGLIPPTPGLPELADSMGLAQDYALLLAHLDDSGPFDVRDRVALKRCLLPRYRRALLAASEALAGRRSA
jgi:CHAD domain-containing protein